MSSCSAPISTLLLYPLLAADSLRLPPTRGDDRLSTACLNAGQRGGERDEGIRLPNASEMMVMIQSINTRCFIPAGSRSSSWLKLGSELEAPQTALHPQPPARPTHAGGALGHPSLRKGSQTAELSTSGSIMKSQTTELSTSGSTMESQTTELSNSGSIMESQTTELSTSGSTMESQTTELSTSGSIMKSQTTELSTSGSTMESQTTELSTSGSTMESQTTELSNSGSIMESQTAELSTSGSIMKS
ncbi:unnamed protein product [Gadus morhua 'NCC']